MESLGPSRPHFDAIVYVMEGGLLNVQTATARYQVTAATVRRWIRDGNLPAIKTGRAYQFMDRDMRRALEMPRRRGRPSGIQRTQRAKWFHRIAFPGNAVMGLGDAGETWKADAELPGYEDSWQRPRDSHMA
jgi:excisionase family DNA binding protein